MAGANKIQILRGTQAEKTASSASLLPGQPLYITDTNYLCVGNGSSTVSSAVPIRASYANSSGSASSATTALSVQNGTVNIKSTSTDIYLNATRSLLMNSGSAVNINSSTLAINASTMNINTTTMNIVADDSVSISAVGEMGDGKINLLGETHSSRGITISDGFNVQVGEVGSTAKYTANSIIMNNSYTLTLPLETGTLATQAWVNSHAGGGTVDIQVTENPDGTVNLIFP